METRLNLDGHGHAGGQGPNWHEDSMATPRGEVVSGTSLGLQKEEMESEGS